MSIEQLEKKLYVIENLHGERSTEAVQATKDFFYELSRENDRIISASLQGSSFKGYSSEKSDIDLSILYDSSGVKYNSSEYWKIKQQIDDDINKAREQVNAPAHIQALVFDINPDIIKQNYLPNNRFKELSLIFSAGFGPKLKQYQKYWIEYINNLSDIEKQEIIDKIINLLVDSEIDRYMVKKIIPSQEKRKNLKQKRIILWEKRLKNLGLSF